MKKLRVTRHDGRHETQRVHPIIGAIPRNPTKGWLYTALERLGVASRGKGYSEDKLRAMLAEHGVYFDDVAPETNSDNEVIR